MSEHGGPPHDLGTVDAIARIALAARRRGRRVVVVGASVHLRELLALAGLARIVDRAGDQSSSRGGRPNRGKKRAVSRKNVIPARRSPSISSTWSDHGS